MALRALLFVQAASRAAGTPFLNKVLGRHGVLALEVMRGIGVGAGWAGDRQKPGTNALKNVGAGLLRCSVSPEARGFSA